MKKTKVLITGGTGLVGTYLTQLLLDKNYEVVHLTRRNLLKSIVPTAQWNYKTSEIDADEVLSADIIIHLAGANIAEKRWSKARKQEILDSRVKTTELLFDTIKNRSYNLKAFISASATGYYGAITSGKTFSEDSAANNDFLGSVCEKWENAADAFQEIGIRTVKIRTGVALSRRKGALEKIVQSFKFGARVVLGSGKQYIPWIHIHDLCNIYIKAIEDNKMQGAYNAVAPEEKTYSEFAEDLAPFYKFAILKMKMPSFVVKLLFGEMSAVVLEGSKISVSKIQKAGFKFQYPTLKSALKNLISKN